MVDKNVSDKDNVNGASFKLELGKMRRDKLLQILDNDINRCAKCPKTQKCILCINNMPCDGCPKPIKCIDCQN